MEGRLDTLDLDRIENRDAVATEGPLRLGNTAALAGGEDTTWSGIYLALFVRAARHLLAAATLFNDPSVV